MLMRKIHGSMVLLTQPAMVTNRWPQRLPDNGKVTAIADVGRLAAGRKGLVPKRCVRSLSQIPFRLAFERG